MTRSFMKPQNASRTASSHKDGHIKSAAPVIAGAALLFAEISVFFRRNRLFLPERAGILRASGHGQSGKWR